jgi:hypothetical protein
MTLHKSRYFCTLSCFQFQQNRIQALEFSGEKIVDGISEKSFSSEPCKNWRYLD